MTSSLNNNYCKLLVLDINIKKISLNDLRTFFTLYGPIEWIETFTETNSAIIYFTSYLPVDRLIENRTCFIKENNVRLRRFRLDQTNWHIDSHTLHIKFSIPIYTNNILDETTIRFCFRNYQTGITKIDIIDNNQALITFLNYDYVDQILLMPENIFVINGISLVFERMMEKIPRKTRWDQPAIPLSTMPILSERNPVVHKLISHIEYLTKQLREQPNHSRKEIERLEAEIFVLKNENAKLKSKQSTNKNIEQRLTALEDISNRFVNKKDSNNHRRERTPSHEKYSKRRRYQINDNYAV